MVCTALSAELFDEVWYGAVVKCLMPFYQMNSLDMNAGQILGFLVTHVLLIAFQWLLTM